MTKWQRFLWCLWLAGVTAFTPPIQLQKNYAFAGHQGCVVRPARQSHRTLIRTTCVSLQAHNSQQRFPLRKKISRAAASFVLGLSLMLRSASPAMAVTEVIGIPGDIKIDSLRPGITPEQAEAALRGEDLDDAEVIVGSPSTEEEEQPKAKVSKKSPKKKVAAYDYGDGDDDSDLDVAFEGEVVPADVPESPATKGTVDSFGLAKRTKPSAKMYATSAFMVLIIPITWLEAREVLRARRERRYVEKGMEILAAQKAEYFNVTNKSDDSDIEDELKGIKTNETSTDSDDADNDEGDDDDDDGEYEDDDDDDDDDEDDDE